MKQSADPNVRFNWRKRIRTLAVIFAAGREKLGVAARRSLVARGVCLGAIVLSTVPAHSEISDFWHYPFPIIITPPPPTPPPPPPCASSPFCPLPMGCSDNKIHITIEGEVDFEWCLPECNCDPPHDCDEFEDAFREANGLGAAGGSCSCANEDWWDEVIELAREAWEEMCPCELDCEIPGGGGGGGGDPPPCPNPPCDPCTGDECGPNPPPPGPDPTPNPPGDGSPGPGVHDPNKDPCNQLMTGDPVDLASGAKAEFHVDLSLVVPGPDFELIRQTTSYDLPADAALAGPRNSISTASYLKVDSSNAIWKISLNHLNTSRTFVASEAVQQNPPAESNKFYQPGPARDYIFATTVVLDNKVYAIWRHVTTDQCFHDYFRAWQGGPGVPATDPDLAGLLLHETDPYGNRRIYQYTLYGPVNDRSPRQTKIYFYSAAQEKKIASVDLDWDAGAGSTHSGRLLEVASFRHIGLNDIEYVIPLAEVQYTYKLSTDNYDSSVGGAGDLIQTKRTTFLDDDRELIEITQYRYHNNVNEQTVDLDGDQLLEVGHAHQLKMVVSSASLLWLADRTEKSIEVVADEVMQAADAEDIDAFAPDITPLALATKIIPKYEWDEPYRVIEQIVRSGCACSGSMDGRRLEYEYWSYGSGAVSETVRITEFLELATSGSDFLRQTYHDIWRPDGDGTTPYLVNRAILDSEDVQTANIWVEHFEYDPQTYLLIKRFSPSAADDYTPGTPASGNDPAVQPTYVPHASQGQVVKYEYNDDKLLLNQSVRDETGAFLKLESYVYGDSQDEVLRFLPVQHDLHRGDPQNGPTNLTTTYSYGFHAANSFAIAWTESRIEAATVAENGPGGTLLQVDLYDEAGRKYWTRLFDGAIVNRQFDDFLGVATHETRNAAPAAVTDSPYDASSASEISGDPSASGNVPGWGRLQTGELIDGGALTWRTTYNRHAQVTSETTPSGATSFLLRQMRAVPGGATAAKHYCEISLPHVADDSSEEIYRGPATVRWFRNDGQLLLEADFPVSGDWREDPSNYSITWSNFLRRIQFEFDQNGRMAAMERWWDANSSTRLYRTEYEHDAQGRLVQVRKPNGTDLGYQYDLLDRLTAESTQEVDQNGDVTNEYVAREYFYDSAGAALSGVGDGHLTLVRDWVDDQDYRDTQYYYDERGRRIAAVLPDQPDWVRVYDNLDNVVRSAQFTSLPSTIDETTIDSNLSERLTYVENSYDQLGRLYRTQSAYQPTSATSDSRHSYVWYNERGGVVATWTPGGPALKTTYDGHARATVAYITDRRDDPAPGTSGSYAAVYDAANHRANIADDLVLQQTESVFDQDLGRVDLVIKRSRTHDADAQSVTTGSLDQTGLLSDGVITTYSGNYYDALDRVTRSINFGANDALLRAGVSAPAWPPSPYDEYEDQDYPSARIVTYLFDETTGRLTDVIDPEGRITRSVYDDLGRAVATIENYEDAVVEWDNTDDRWSADGLEFAEPDRDRVTSIVFNGNDDPVRRIAHFPTSTDGEAVQITEYEYGVTTGTGSKLRSHDLLYQLHYPDEDTGLPGTDAKYLVKFSYNRQGEAISTTDQRGVVHDYTYDHAGRTVMDEVTVPGTASYVDDAINGLTYEYDNLGRPVFVRSHKWTSSGSPQTGVENEVQYEYNEFNELIALWQETDGVVESQPPSPKVSFGYSETNVEGHDVRRMTSITYPNGTIREMNFGQSGSLSDRISRAESLDIDGWSSPLVEYQYAGVSSIVVANFPGATGALGVLLDRAVAEDGTRTQGTYYGLSGFGEVLADRWIDFDYEPTNPATGHANRPAIFDLQYEYTKIGNRLKRDDRTVSQQWTFRQEEFKYDELYRLDRHWRGVRTAGNPGDFSNPSQFTFHSTTKDWELDALGNWTDLHWNPNSSETYQSHETREYNQANELIERDAGSGTLGLEYDHAGNISYKPLSSNAGHNFYHDAWNRLMRVEYAEISPPATVDLIENSYYGTGWRATKKSDRSVPLDGDLEHARTMYYDADWRLVYEEVDDDASTGVLSRKIEYHHGLRGLNDILLKRASTTLNNDSPNMTFEQVRYYATDSQFSVRAVIGGNAQVLERVSYDAYGNARHHRAGDIVPDTVGNHGSADVFDQFALNSNWNGFGTGDLDRSGVVDVFDQFILLADWGAAEAEGKISLDAEDNIFGYTGGIFDAEAQIYLFRNRYYDPSLGRFLQRDPLGYVDGMNLYLYGLSNPLMFMDPLGLQSFGPCSEDDAYFLIGLWQVIADYASEFADSVEYIAENPETMYEGFYHLADQSSTAMADAATQTALNDAHGDFTQVGAGDIYLNLLERQVGVNNVAEGVAGVDRAGNELITDPIERVSLIATGISEMAGTAAGAAAPLTGAANKAAGATDDVLRATQNADKMAAVRKAGQAGEDAAGVSGPKKGVKVGNRTVYPDEVNHAAKTMREVKNVQSQSYTKQLRTYTEAAQQNGYKFTLQTPSNTTLSGPLHQAINQGDIIHTHIPGM